MIDKCWCRVTPAGPDMGGDGRMLYDITYCPLHRAAPKMLKALKKLRDWGQTGGLGDIEIPEFDLDDLITEAEPQEAPKTESRTP